MSARTAEEAPLLRSLPLGSSPIVWSQFSLVLWIQLVEPLSTQLISPFAPQLIRDIGITHGNEAQVGYYVGIMHSIFYMVQAITVLPWSRVSDHVGRKPILLTGLLGVSLSMICFGFSETYWGVVLSRALYGALNANVAVVKSSIAEMSDGNMAQMIGYIPITWAVGGAIGPLIGGLLSHPAEQFPDIFGNDFWRTYPYLLPCLITAIFSALCWLTSFTFLKETVRSPIPFNRSFWRDRQENDPRTLPAGVESSQSRTPDYTLKLERPKPLRELLTRKVIITAINYGLLSLIDIALRTLQPLILSTPITLGGLGLPPSTIGKVMSAMAMSNCLMQLLFFAKIQNYLGSKRTFIVGLSLTFPIIFTYPLMIYVARMQGVGPLVWLVVVLQMLFIPGIGFSYGSGLILISAASPNRASLGATNGFCQMTISVMRSIGPALFSSLFALSIEHQYLGGHFVYYFLSFILGGAILSASLLHDASTFSVQS